MPLDDKSKKRVDKLFSDLERIAEDESPKAASEQVESSVPQLLSDNKKLLFEIDVLNAHIHELETQLLKDAAARTISRQNMKEDTASSILYEKEHIGYLYGGDNLLPLQGTNFEPSKLEDGIKAPLMASGEVIGEMQVSPSSERTWTLEEENLANAVAQQASFQIQNLRLLAATERARAEAQAATRQFTHQNWESFMDAIHQSERVGFVYDQATVSPFSESSPNEHDLHETVNVLDEQVGNLFLRADPLHPLTEDDKRLVSAVARQLGQQVENLRLLADASRARADAEEATRRLTRESWQSFAGGRGDAELGFMYDSVKVSPISESYVPHNVNFVQPLSVRGEIIGQLAVAGWENIPPRAMELANTIAEQVSVHIENLRLFEETQTALAESRRLARAIESTADMVVITDRKGTIQFANPAFEKTTGYTVNEAMGGNPRLLKSGEQDADFYKSMWGTILSGQAWSGEVTNRRKDGSFYNAQLTISPIVDEHGEILQFVAVQRDVTQSKHDEAVLAQRAIQLETVAAVSTTASTVLNPDELLQAVVDLTQERFHLYHTHIYLADESWNALLLAAGSGEIGRQMVKEGHTIRIDTEKSIVARATRERRAIIVNDVRSEEDFLPNSFLPETQSEMAVPMIAGEKVIGVFDVQSKVSGHFTREDANIFTTLAVQVAIALQNARLYVEQSATVTQLRELDRLKSSFLANMSHELRTPLNSILGFSDVMLEELDGPLTENMANDLGLIQKNGRHLLHLINDVLDMAKIESGRMNLHPEKFRVHEIVEEVTSITSTLASEKNLALFIEKESDQEVEITADRTRLRQVMINVVNNAIKFTEKGKISINVIPQSEQVLITVRDTGIGIPPDKLEAVFQEFTQVDTSSTRKAGGTGLGLPISRRLVEMHGGRLWAESSGIDGEGTRFFIELPLEAKLTEPAEKTSK
ncbi:MAG: GAF domain-containing protein [Chloroflexi bacterium]|nr:GAF domain-containing protein [Chloroflexota bacterium]